MAFFDTIIIFFSCESQKKQENTQTPINQTDTIKQAKKTTEKLSGKQLLDSLLKKAKYRDLKVLKVPTNIHCGYWKEDSLKERIISDVEFNTLGLNKFSQYQFYQRINVWAYLGYYQNNHLFLILSGFDSCGTVSDMLMVDSLGKCKDIIDIGLTFGDMGFIAKSYTKRLNDSTFITYRKDTWGKEISLLKNTHFTIRKDSFFIKRVDTLAYKDFKLKADTLAYKKTKF